MVKKLIAQIMAALAGLWLASLIVPGAQIQVLADSGFFGIGLTAQWQIILLLGISLGLLNSFVKPILSALTLPLRIITLGLFGFVVNGGLIWILDVIFKEFSAPLLFPLLWTTLIIWGINLIFLLFIKE